MAQATRRPRRAAATGQPEGPTLHVRVPVPQNSPITVTDLKTLDERELNEILEKAKTAQIRFIILNAPFKVQPVK